MDIKSLSLIKAHLRRLRISKKSVCFKLCALPSRQINMADIFCMKLSFNGKISLHVRETESTGNFRMTPIDFRGIKAA